MRTQFRNPGWLATVFAMTVILMVLAFQRGVAQVGRTTAIRSAVPAPTVAVGAQGGVGSGSFVMDGDWFYILRGDRFYKVQKSTMTVFQTLDLH